MFKVGDIVIFNDKTFRDLYGKKGIIVNRGIKDLNCIAVKFDAVNFYLVSRSSLNRVEQQLELF